ncbi:hypothetical protein I546_3140 [Mycobacterium kansasii 732]|nr:hypothetical protein I546_3140 [Mycobacterium kansasii 732]
MAEPATPFDQRSQPGHTYRINSDVSHAIPEFGAFRAAP